MVKYYYDLLLALATDHSCCHMSITAATAQLTTVVNECDGQNLLLTIIVHSVDNIKIEQKAS